MNGIHSSCGGSQRLSHSNTIKSAGCGLVAVCDLFRYLNDYHPDCSCEIFDDLQQQKNNPGRDCEILGIFMCILGRICDLWRDENTVQRVDLSFDMKYITAYITKNINRNITLTELSALCCMSQNTLLRKFRKAFGKSPMNYIREQRLRLSTELLQNSSMRIDEIAAQCGFNSSSHFIAMFRQKYKCTPADFRMKSIDSGEFDHIVNAGE
jgi:AraC-like DNA-binding protein